MLGLSPVGLDEDAVDLGQIDGADLGADGFDEAGQRKVTCAAKKAFAAAHDEGEGFGGEDVVAQAAAVEFIQHEGLNGFGTESRTGGGLWSRARNLDFLDIGWPRALNHGFSKARPGTLHGWRNRGAFRGMLLTGNTRSKLSRATPEWRLKYGPGENRRHHLLSQEMLQNPSFISQMRALGFSPKEMKRFVNKWIADIPNVKHYEIHAEGWNKTWRAWLDFNPEFSVADLRAQIRSMAREFEIPKMSLGGPSY